MTTILIVEKLGSIKEVQIKNCTEEEFFKKAGYKTNEGFKCHTVWNVELENKNYSISLYGKTSGRANQENKYEFPPPVDKLLFFGNCLLVNQTLASNSSTPLHLQNGNQYVNLKKKEWEDIYEKLYGGFDDIGDDDTEDEFDDEDDEDIDDTKLTKTGYIKDDFVVDEEEDDEEEEEDEDEEEDDDDNDDDDDDIPKIKPKVLKISKKRIKKIKNKILEIPSIVKKEEEELYLDCKSELSEESYIGDEVESKTELRR